MHTYSCKKGEETFFFTAASKKEAEEQVKETPGAKELTQLPDIEDILHPNRERCLPKH
jgi:hypothetical protein